MTAEEISSVVNGVDPTKCAAAPHLPTIDLIRALPKIELHAHLGGSITQKKLVELLERQGNGHRFSPFDPRDDVANSVAKCFDYFDKVNKVVQSLDALKDCTLHVLESFAADNCRYLELRTSPKQYKTILNGEERKVKEFLYTTKAQYLETVRDAIHEFQSHAAGRFGFVMEVKLLLSVNRGNVTSERDALEQIDDVIEMSTQFNDIVVGIDVSGDPSKLTVVPFVLPALKARIDALRRLGLPITYHAGETTAQHEECELVLECMRELNIRRLGHVLFWPDHCREALFTKDIHDDRGKIGIELCPTSNMCLMGLKTLEGHHFPKWWKKSDKVLLSINTDDSGMFACDLTSELYDMASTFKLSYADLVDLQRQAAQSSFHPDKDAFAKAFEVALADVRSNGAPDSKKQKL